MDDVLEVIESQKEPDDDFVSKNGAWLLTVIGLFSACVGGVFTYFLRSRCRKLKFGCLECDRDVLDLKSSDAIITTEQNNSAQ